MRGLTPASRASGPSSVPIWPTRGLRVADRSASMTSRVGEAARNLRSVTRPGLEDVGGLRRLERLAEEVQRAGGQVVAAPSHAEQAAGEEEEVNPVLARHVGPVAEPVHVAKRRLEG